MPRTHALIYATCAGIWMLLVERLPLWLDLEPERAAILRIAGIVLLVLASALALYVLLSRYRRASEAAAAALEESKREAQQAHSELERRVTDRTRQLEDANRELESFAYAVSHDLRAPLRSMSGFSQVLQDTAPAALDEKSRHYLQRIQDASLRMSGLIEDLLGLSRIGRSELSARPVSLTKICEEAAGAQRARHPGREVEVTIAPDMCVEADARLLRIAMDNLLSNAWKYTARAEPARITIGLERHADGPVYFVRDNGVGFDMAYAGKLFTPFQRLHSEVEFPGNGIGLVTVQRIIARHGGRIWAQAEPDTGATFYFTLAPDARESARLRTQISPSRSASA